MTTYIANIPTPIGKVKGKLTLEQQGEKLSGKIEAMGMQSKFSNGSIKGKECIFSGIIHTLVGAITYQATGKLEGDRIVIKAKTNKGEFTLEGKRQ